MSDSSPTEELAAQDLQGIEQLRASGADLAQPRPVDHFLYFGSRDDAEAAAREARELGSRVSVTPPGEGLEQWSLVLTGEVIVTSEVLAGAREELTALAERHHGEYDGWGAPAEP